MAYLINLDTITDIRGSLCVIEKILPFDIKRVYYIFDVKEKRGGHRHKTTKQALICLGGKCNVFVDNGKEKKVFKLNKNNKCLILEPEDWHYMEKFTKKAILLVLSSNYYDKEDYITEGY